MRQLPHARFGRSYALCRIPEPLKLVGNRRCLRHSKHICQPCHALGNLCALHRKRRNRLPRNFQRLHSRILQHPRRRAYGPLRLCHFCIDRIRNLLRFPWATNNINRRRRNGLRQWSHPRLHLLKNALVFFVLLTFGDNGDRRQRRYPLLKGGRRRRGNANRRGRTGAGIYRFLGRRRFIRSPKLVKRVMGRRLTLRIFFPQLIKCRRAHAGHRPVLVSYPSFCNCANACSRVMFCALSC